MLSPILKKETVLVLALSLFTYLLFFYPLLNSNTVISGNDPENYFYPSRYYLYESLKNGRFPFWTERIFSGFPIYADSERVYLNPLNLGLTAAFGPFTSYKILHLAFYLLGSFSLYSFLKARNMTTLGYAAANLIYFFSFFQLYHLQHFNFVLSMYALPAGVCLVDKLLRTGQARFFSAHVLLTSLLVYFGSFQSVILYLLPSVVYFAVFFKSLGYAPLGKAKYLVLLGGFYFALVFALTLPQLAPTAQLYLHSERASDSTNLTQGSFNPLMLVNVFYPYFFGFGENYKWNMVNEDYLIHETYMYVGIVGLLIAGISILKMQDTAFKKFLLVLALMFFILGFVKSIPLLNSVGFPIITQFRYWGRSVVLFNFALACAVAHYLSFPAKITLTDVKKAIKPLFLLFSIFLLLVLYNLPSQEIKLTSTIFLSGGFLQDFNFILWILLIFAFFGVFSLFMLFAEKPRIFASLAVLLIFIDLFYFGRNIPFLYFTDIKSFPARAQHLNTVELTKYDFKRVAFIDPRHFWNRNLYYQSWGIVGYSQFEIQKYADYFKQNGIESVKTLSAAIPIDFYKDLGVEHLVTPTQEIAINQNANPLFNFEGKITKIRFNEGYFLLNVDSDKEQIIETKILNYPGWKLRVNDQPVSFLNAVEDLHLKFAVPQGQAQIELKFVPVIFYVSLGVSVVFISILVLSFKKFYLKSVG